MGWGRLYEVAENDGQLFAGCQTKEQWYEALGTLDLENAPLLDAEDSIRFWRAKLREIWHQAEQFFIGDMHAEYDEYSDPNVCFNSPESVRVFLGQLNTFGKSFFVSNFSDDGLDVNESWLYDPLCEFLQEVCSRGSAVILLWED